MGVLLTICKYCCNNFPIDLYKSLDHFRRFISQIFNFQRWTKYFRQFCCVQLSWRFPWVKVHWIELSILTSSDFLKKCEPQKNGPSESRTREKHPNNHNGKHAGPKDHKGNQNGNKHKPKHQSSEQNSQQTTRNYNEGQVIGSKNSASVPNYDANKDQRLNGQIQPRDSLTNNNQQYDQGTSNQQGFNWYTQWQNSNSFQGQPTSM